MVSIFSICSGVHHLGQLLPRRLGEDGGELLPHHGGEDDMGECKGGNMQFLFFLKKMETSHGSTSNKFKYCGLLGAYLAEVEEESEQVCSTINILGNLF